MTEEKPKSRLKTRMFCKSVLNFFVECTCAATRCRKGFPCEIFFRLPTLRDRLCPRGCGDALLYLQQAGVFIWSLSDEGSIVQTKLKASGPQLVQPRCRQDRTRYKDSSRFRGRENGDHRGSRPGAGAGLRKNPSLLSILTLLNSSTGTDLGNWEITQYGGEGDVFVTDEEELEFGFGPF